MWACLLLGFPAEFSGVPKGIRTPDPRLRRPLLYPAELRTHIASTAFAVLQKRVMGIEPTYPAWKAGVLPLNYTRTRSGWQDSNLRPPGPKPGALAKLSHTPICCFAVSFLLSHRSDFDIISPYSILVNTFLHFFEINFSNTTHPAFLQCFR